MVNSTVSTCLVIITFIMTSFALGYAKSILLPFVIGIFIAFTISPLIGIIQQKLRFNRTFSLILVAGSAFVLGLVVVILISLNLKGMVANFATYSTRIENLTSQIDTLIKSFGYDANFLTKENLTGALKPLFSFAGLLSKAFLDLIADSLLILIIVCFLLTGAQLKIPESTFLTETSFRIRTYLTQKISLSLLMGLFTWLSLAFIGLDMAFFFGMMAFILNFIPNIGSVIAVLLPLPVALLSFDTPTPIVLTVLIPGLFQFIFGTIIEPKISGDSLDLHPVTLLLTLMFWGLIWGIPGMFLAAPLTVIAKVALAQSGQGKFLGDLMAGRWH